MIELRIHNAGSGIRTMRRQRGMSLRQLATRLGWDKCRLSKYETGRLSLSLPVLDEIAQALHYPPEALVLYCLKHHYPRMCLKGSRAETLMERLITELEGVDSQQP